MTAEEWIIEELKAVREELKLTQKANEELKAENSRLQSIIQLVKENTTFENGTIMMYITFVNAKERDSIAEALGIKEVKSNE